jgi:hypothetical protein
MLAGGDVAEHDPGQAGEKAQLQVAVARLQYDQQVLTRAAGPSHRSHRRGRVPGQGQRDDNQRQSGQPPVPDPA